MSEQAENQEATLARFSNPFLRDDAPPVITDPYSVPIEQINVIDGRLFQQDIHWDHFKRLREEDPVHLNLSLIHI